MESGYPIIRDLKSVVGIDGNVLFQAQEFQTHVNPGQYVKPKVCILLRFFKSNFWNPQNLKYKYLAGWLDDSLIKENGKQIFGGPGFKNGKKYLVIYRPCLNPSK